MKKLYKVIFLFTFYLASSSTLAGVAEKNIEIKNDGIYISNITSNELETFFSAYGYNDYIHMPEWKYPPIFLNNMPVDFDKIEDKNKRNNLFLRIMAPIALKVNETFLLEHYEILALDYKHKETKVLSPEEKLFIEEKAIKYDVFTRATDEKTRYDFIFHELDMKVYSIPASISVGMAAIETDWGNSPSIKRGNSLYKEKNWYSNEGLEVEDAEEEDKNLYRIKTFDSLYDSMYSFILKVNSNVDYETFRFSRKGAREREKENNGRFLAHGFLLASNLQNFIGMLDYTITFYEITNFDNSSLGVAKEKSQ